MKSKDYYKQIAEQERRSSVAWRETDRETSPEDTKKATWLRVLNRAKNDKDDHLGPESILQPIEVVKKKRSDWLGSIG